MATPQKIPIQQRCPSSRDMGHTKSYRDSRSFHIFPFLTTPHVTPSHSQLGSKTTSTVSALPNDSKNHPATTSNNQATTSWRLLSLISIHNLFTLTLPVA